MIYKTQLENGLQIVIEQDTNAKSCTFEYIVACGALDEYGSYNGTNNFGVAHFVEHMMFKGTNSRTVDDINNDIAAIGGYCNAATSFDHTLYYISSPADKWKDNLEILNDIFWNSTFPEDEFEQEKTVILEELKMYEDKPRSKCMENLDILINRQFANRQRVAGTIDSVSKLTVEDLKKFVKIFYQPNNIALLISGNVPIKEVLADINIFLLYKEKEIIQDRDTLFNKDIMNNQLIRLQKNDLAQAHFGFAIKGVAPYKKDYYIQDLIADYLGGGFISKLYNIIREKLGLAYTVNVSTNPLRDTSYIMGYCGLKKENINKVHNIIVKELNKLKHELIDDKELEILKALYRGKSLLVLETTSAKLSVHEDNFIYNTDYTIDSILDIVMNTTSQDIQQFANKYFNEKNICWSIVEPK